VNDPDRWHPSDGLDDDAIFADIVAHLNDDVADEPLHHAAQDGVADDESTHEDDPNPGPEPKEPPESGQPRGEQDHWPDDAPPLSPAADDPHGVPTPQVWRAQPVDDEDQEHFEPPPVTPLPVGDLQFWAIIAGMGGGPLLLLYLAFFNRDAGSYWILIALAMSIGGFALLVSRMPGQQEDDDDGSRL